MRALSRAACGPAWGRTCAAPRVGTCAHPNSIRPTGVAAPLALAAQRRYGGGTQRKEILMHPAADRIRNVALVGHRGSGKTSLHEALLFEAGVLGRLGSVPDGTTVSDSDPDEQARQMSISATLSSLQWQRAQDQPARHAGRAELRGGRARRAAGVRVGGVRGQRRDGRGGHHARGCGRAPPSSTSRGCCS